MILLKHVTFTPGLCSTSLIRSFDFVHDVALPQWRCHRRTFCFVDCLSLITTAAPHPYDYGNERGKIYFRKNATRYTSALFEIASPRTCREVR